jgi:putative tryptophan/tyrosine transport system substrate-binding protein
MRRRNFIALLGAAAGWPLTSRAQQTVPVVGFLSGRSPDEAAHLVASYRQGLTDVGYSEGQNVRIEYRWAKGDDDKLADLAKDLISRQVSVIAATGGNKSAIAAKTLTKTIPIVFTSGSDPVAVGLVTSLSRPEGNVTGVSWFSSQLTAKGLGLLRELIPGTTSVAVLVDPHNPEAASQPSDAQAAARALGHKLLILNATTIAEIDGAFATLVAQRADALVVAGDPFLTSRRDQIVALAARYAVPVIAFSRDWAVAGSLLTYGNNSTASYRKAGVYTGRILRGASLADLPVELDSKFELIINMKTAKALGIAIPNSLQLLADEVIE